MDSELSGQQVDQIGCRDIMIGELKCDSVALLIGFLDPIIGFILVIIIEPNGLIFVSHQIAIAVVQVYHRREVFHGR
jgi:hypothetical protein